MFLQSFRVDRREFLPFSQLPPTLGGHQNISIHAAQPIYESAIASHMSLLGIGTAAQNAYIASRPLLTASNAIQQIITEKYVADFLSLETYNDWRRTGFPALTLAQNPYVNYIPRRWPYSSTEILTNP